MACCADALSRAIPSTAMEMPSASSGCAMAVVAALAAGFVQTGWALADAGASTSPAAPTETAVKAAAAGTTAKPGTMTVEQVRAAIAAYLR